MKDFEILHHGAANGVTGSCHELVLEKNRSVLIDCGIFQGAEQSKRGAGSGGLEIDFNISRVQALFITHAHIDHVGRIPYLLAAGFDGPIFCSVPTATLLSIVLEDALKIGLTRNERLIKQFLGKIKELIVPVEYKEWNELTPRYEDAKDSSFKEQNPKDKVRFKLKPAGHILGSAYIEFSIPADLKANKASNEQQVTSNQKRSDYRVVFSGDLGAPWSPLLPAPRAPYRCDTLVLESTYGDKCHEDRRYRSKKLKAVIERALKDNGAVLIPAFSIGRTQELLYEIEGIINSTQRRESRKEELAFSKTEHRKPNTLWNNIEVIIDSPMAAEFTEVYKDLKGHWDAEARRKVKSGRHPLSFDNLWTVESHKEHLSTVDYIRRRGTPCIVIAASGMCSGGRIMNYLKALIEDKRTDVLFVGYQAQGTPGRVIQKYGPRKHGGRSAYVDMDGLRYDINAGIHTISGYSAHADQSNLVNFVKRMRHQPKEIRLVHGDSNAKRELKVRLVDELDAVDIII